MDNPSFYAIIPANVRYSKNLEPNAKLLYGEITALANQSGFCWASNQYFADLYDVDVRTVKRWLESLSKNEFIYIDITKKGLVSSRKIYINKEMFTKGQKCPFDGTKMSKTKGQKCPPNNTCSNTKNNTTTEKAAPVAVFSEKQSKQSKIDMPSFLTELDISRADKLWLAKTYDVDTLKNAILWATSPQTSISTTMAQAIKWACKNKPQIPLSENQRIEENKQHAEEVVECIHVPENLKIEVLSKHIEFIYLNSQKQSDIILYSDKKFDKKLEELVRKNRCEVGY